MKRKVSVARPAILAVALLSPGAWSRDPERFPLRQIDRPMILPKRMWQERLVWNGILPVEDDWMDSDYSGTQGFLPTLPAWSITDNLQWTAVPMPLFSYLIAGKTTGRESGAYSGLGLALDAGISNFFITSRDFGVLSMLGLRFKKPALDRMWSEGFLNASVSNLDVFAISSALGLGFQVTPRLHAVSTYSLVQFLESDYWLAHSGTQALGLNLNPGFSMEARISFIVADGDVFLNPGAGLAFQW